jgi:RNA polymerase sigma-70 factor, ECF subfamily
MKSSRTAPGFLSLFPLDAEKSASNYQKYPTTEIIGLSPQVACTTDSSPLVKAAANPSNRQRFGERNSGALDPLATGTRVDSARMELLVRLLSRNQEKLFRYIFAILPHEEDARDVLQETCVALARKFDEYDVSKPFLAWAYRFAYLEVLKQRERDRRGTLRLTRDLIDRLAREREEHEPILQARLLALELCLAELDSADREILRHRYELKTNTIDLAEHFGLSRRSLFRKLDHLRGLLSDCITRRLARGAL